jgi:hypothetical protein
MRIHSSAKIQRVLAKANKRVRAYCGPNYFFDYNMMDGKFWFKEKRGPMLNWIFPLDVQNHPLSDITDWEMNYAVTFLRKRRSNEEAFYANKEYRRWYPNA